MPDTLEIIKNAIIEIAGDNVELGKPITRDTSFNQDLELESIEFVMLAEKLQESFGDNVNFADWVAQMDIDKIIALKIGDLVDFVDNSISVSNNEPK